MANNKATFLLEFKEKGIKIIEKTVKELNELGLESGDSAKKIDDLVNSINDLASDAKKANKPVEQLDNSVKDIGNTVNKNKRSIKQFFTDLRQTMFGAKKEADGLNTRITGLIKAAAAFVTIQQTVNYTRELVQNLDRVAIMANRAGVEFNKFNAYSQVAKRFGINIDLISDKFVDLNEFIAEAANFNSGSGLEIFQALNLDAKELIKLDPASQLEKITKAMEGLDANTRRQYIAALNLDDLLPILNNIELVNERVRRTTAAGLNVNAANITKSLDSLSVFKSDLESFNTVVLAKLFDNLDRIYNLTPSKDSILSGDGAQEVADAITSIVKICELLAKTLLVIGSTADYLATALLSTGKIMKANLLETGNFLNKNIFDKMKQSDFDRLKANAKTKEQLEEFIKLEKIWKENVQKRNNAYDEKINNNLSEVKLTLAADIDDIGRRLNDLTNVFSDPVLREDGVLDLGGFVENGNIEQEVKKSLSLLKEELAKIQENIDITNLDIQIDDSLTPELNAKLKNFIINKNKKIKEINDQYPNSDITLIDFKNSQLELKQAEKALEDYYKNVKAKQKEEFDKQVKMFNDQIQVVNIEFDLGLKDSATALKDIEPIFKNMENYVKNNGTLNDLLLVQQQRQQNINSLKRQSLEVENLTIELLRLQNKEVEANEIQRARAIQNIKDNVKDVGVAAESIDLTNKIFDLRKFQANLAEAEKNLSTLNSKLENTDFFDTDSRLKIEKEISAQKEIQKESQKQLGIYAEESNKSAILTVKQVRELDVLLKDSMLDNFSDFIAGTKSAQEAFNDFAASFLKNISKMILEQLYLNAVQSISGGSGSSNVGIASSLFSALPSFHTGIGGDGSTSTFQPKVQIPGVTKNDEGIAILRKGEKVVTQNQQYNESIKSTSSSTSNSFFLDSEQLSNAALNNSYGEEAVLKIITKNRNTIKNL